ncbi:BTAD domain-containing putative transcriptional regulator [Streptomyces exfoliatus]|uniref:BTAD domain-containing putative transcriptional regulator n=1 Tax=Streptomyces exfoliatus TaxID=1905 RepID=UPI003C2AE2D1
MARALLAALLLAPGRVVALDRLESLLWEGPPTGHRPRVPAQPRVTAAPFARRRLTGHQPGRGAHAARRGGGARHRRLAAAFAEARRARAAEDWRGVVRATEETAAFWRGDPLAEFPGLAAEAAAEVTRWQEARLQCLELWADAAAALGRDAELLTELRRPTAEFPLRETFQAHLLLVLHRTGRRAEALEAYHALRRVFVDALGVEPGPGVRSAFQRVLDDGEEGTTGAALPEASRSTPVPFQDPTSSPWPTGHRFADRTRAKHVTVHELLAAGLSRRAIGRQLHMTSRTVKLFADAATPEDLFHGQWQGRPSKLDAFKPYLDVRWNQGCTNAWTVWEEIVPLGYEGSYQRVRAYFREKRLSPGPVTARPPSPRVVAGWILRRPESLTETDRLRLKAVLVHCPELDALTGHVRSFGQMLTERQGERLPQWLDAVRQDDLPSLHTLAAGIERDRDAVIAGLTLPWNSGVVEGHVNRIKMLKRQMFGRAGFDLLRKRVLLYS